MHILDIAENSVRAHARNIEISVVEDRKDNLLYLEIKDDGQGMTENQRKAALDPFFTTKTTRRFGLGLPLLAQAARGANGDLELDSTPGRGTWIKATFQADHVDIKPLGDIPQTFVTLIMGHPEINYLFRARFNHSEFVFDSKEVKKQLDGVPINSPEVLAVIKTNINNEFNYMRREK